MSGATCSLAVEVAVAVIDYVIVYLVWIFFTLFFPFALSSLSSFSFTCSIGLSTVLGVSTGFCTNVACFISRFETVAGAIEAGVVAVTGLDVVCSEVALAGGYASVWSYWKRKGFNLGSIFASCLWKD